MSGRLVRSLVLLGLLLGVQALPGVIAQAQAACTGTLAARADCSTKAEAYQFVQTLLQPQASVSCVGTWGYGSRIAINDDPPDRVSGYLMCKNSSGSESLGYGKDVFHPTANGGCPAGSTWNDTNKTCHNEAECLAKPGIINGGTTNLTMFSGHRCDGGCDYTLEGGTIQGVSTAGGQSISVAYGGEWKPSGAACTAGDPDFSGSWEPQACITDGTSGKSVCVNKSGKQCYQLGAMTKQICWEAGETGEKTSGPELQVRNAGNLPTTPQTPPPAGDTFQQQGTPTTSTTTINNTTNTTTTTNYTTTTGVNAGGGGDSGEPADGSGDGSGSGGEGDGNATEKGILDKLTDLVDGLIGDGQDHAGDGAQAGDTDVFADDEVVDGSSLDSSGFVGGGGSCPALWTNPGGDGLAAAFASETPAPWCDFVGWIYAAVVALATITGVIILAGGRGEV